MMNMLRDIKAELSLRRAKLANLEGLPADAAGDRSFEGTAQQPRVGRRRWAGQRER